MKMRSESNVKGCRDVYSSHSDANSISMIVESLLSRVNTAIPVRVDKVISAESAGGPAGWVSATALVCQLDGWDQVVEPVFIPRLPYLRLQSGKAAIVMDPQVGDVGLAVFADRDSSLLEQGRHNPRPKQPGTFRRFSKSDGFYIGGFLGQTPETFIELDPEARHIRIHGPEKVTVECRNAEVNAGESVEISTQRACLSAPKGTTINGDVLINGSIAWTGEAMGDGLGGPTRFRNGIRNHNGILNTGGLINNGGKLSSNNVSLEDHVHDGVQPGAGNTKKPVSSPH
jgi:phage baseplate assembly protein gpV